MATSCRAVPQSFCTHLVEYFSSADGPADLLKGVQLTAHYATAFSRTADGRRIAEDVRETASDAWSMLVWADVIAEGGKLCQKTHRLFQAYFYPSQGDQMVMRDRPEYISQLARNTLLQGVDFLTNASEGVFLLHSRKWVDLGRYAPGVYTLFEGTSIISDLADARDQWNTLNLIQEIRPFLNAQHVSERWTSWGYVTPLTPEEARARCDQHALTCDHHARLALVRLIKDGLSITLSIAGLGIMLTGAAVESSLFLTGFLLLLATAFLLTKIFAHFYERCVVSLLDVPPIGLVVQQPAPVLIPA